MPCPYGPVGCPRPMPPDEGTGNLLRLHATISGLVQMVGFRMFVVRHAERLGAAGWVRNTDEGEVEVLAEGTRQSLEQLLGHLRRGPSGARVTHIEETWSQATGEFHTFRITW